MSALHYTHEIHRLSRVTPIHRRSKRTRNACRPAVQTMVPEKDLRRVRRSRSPTMQRLAEKLGLGRAQAETCIKPSKVGGRRFSKVELGGKEYNSPDPEECVKPSTLKRKNGSDHCLDLDLHTRLAQARAERAQEREKKKLEASASSALKASAARHQKRNQRELEATSSAPAPPPKRQRSNPLPSVAPESVPKDLSSVMPDDLRPAREMTWGENSLARALPM